MKWNYQSTQLGNNRTRNERNQSDVTVEYTVYMLHSVFHRNQNTHLFDENETIMDSGVQYN